MEKGVRKYYRFVKCNTDELEDIKAGDWFPARVSYMYDKFTGAILPVPFQIEIFKPGNRTPGLVQASCFDTADNNYGYLVTQNTPYEEVNFMFQRLEYLEHIIDGMTEHGVWNGYEYYRSSVYMEDRKIDICLNKNFIIYYSLTDAILSDSKRVKVDIHSTIIRTPISWETVSGQLPEVESYYIRSKLNGWK